MFFPLGLSNFWVGAWFPFDEGQKTAAPSHWALLFLEKIELLAKTEDKEAILHIHQVRL